MSDTPAVSREPDADAELHADTLPCARCGYDLRVHPRDGVCPECGAPVAEAVALARLPRRPAWADSDPRWRRRVIAGAWVLTLVPLMPWLEMTGLTERISAPVGWGPWWSIRTLGHTYLPLVYDRLAFCIGAVLLFARERGRRADRFDNVRPWGVASVYLLLLSAVIGSGLLVALVSVGVGTLFQTLPPEHQPPMTERLLGFGRGYLRILPIRSGRIKALWFIITVLSAAIMFLTCFPIRNALRATGFRRGAWWVIGPLTVNAAWVILWLVRDTLMPPPDGWSNAPAFFFDSYVLVSGGQLRGGGEANASTNLFRKAQFFAELAKWLPFLFLAVCLTVAQVRAWGRTPGVRTGA